MAHARKRIDLTRDFHAKPPLTRNLALAGACISSAALTGCLALPIPNVRAEGSGVKSQVIDAATSQPVANAKVLDPIDGGTTTTDRNGQFCLAPHYQWHAGYLFGVIGYPIWPTTGDVIAAGRVIRVDASGYVTKEFNFGWAPGAIKETKFDHDILTVPPLLIQKISFAGDHHADQ